MMRRLFVLALAITIWLGIASTASAANLVPCSESPAFQERMENAPEGYYYNQPFKAYASELRCGEDGLPHLVISLNRAVDVAIPFAIFFYVAGFIGWSGRSYLQTANKAKSPEQKEIFIDMPLAIQSFIKGLMWPVLALREFLSGELTMRDQEVPISPR